MPVSAAAEKAFIAGLGPEAGEPSRERLPLLRGVEGTDEASPTAAATAAAASAAVKSATTAGNGAGRGKVAHLPWTLLLPEEETSRASAAMMGADETVATADDEDAGGADTDADAGRAKLARVGAETREELREGRSAGNTSAPALPSASTPESASAAAAAAAAALEEVTAAAAATAAEAVLVATGEGTKGDADVATAGTRRAAEEDRPPGSWA